MKTPIQEFIEVLKIQRDMLTEKVDIGNYPEPVIEYYRLRQIVYNDVISLAESMLEKEKEVMCEFADDYRDDSCYATIQGGVSSEETTEEFFNKTFKTKDNG